MTAPDEVLQFTPPPADLADAVFGFVHRRDARGGDVVLILPEARTSVQVRRADPYHIRETADGSPWRQVPEISLWGPRLARGYDYAAQRIEVFGFGLTPAGFRALTGAAPGNFVNEASPLESVAPALAAAIGALPAATFDGWRKDMIEILRAATAVAGAARQISAALATIADTESIPVAAKRLGLSDRHFRRLFAEEFGASPKTYARILRFDRTLRRLHPRPWEAPDRPDTDDYADQAHLIREFCAFAEITPGAYVRNKERHGDRILRSIVVEGVAPPDR